jgi:hypothetical protein
MLLKADTENRAVGVPELMQAGIAHFTTRILELRRRGYGIENEQWRDAEGQHRSQYWLTNTPDEDAQ